MKIQFNKYQGAGNDFIIIDNRKNIFDSSDSRLISLLCDRRFGIGADGLILIQTSDDADYNMLYFNADGFEGSMCGNGGRCSAAFAIRQGITGNKLSFRAIDGIHHAHYDEGLISLSLNDVSGYEIIDNNYFINTGSPHYMIFTDDADSIDVNAQGQKIRWSEAFSPKGTNVNFVQVENDGIYVRTFERGVEAETLSCGTGVTASAIASVLSCHFDTVPVKVRTRGGKLSVSLKEKGGRISSIVLSGPATFVFEGEIEV